jgi:hypothetical protein
MLFHSAKEIIRDPAIQNMSSAGDDVDVIVMILLGHCKVPPLRYEPVTPREP